MSSTQALDAARRIHAECTDANKIDDSHIASIIQEEIGVADAITALRRCDKMLEQLGVSLNERDFVVKAIAKLEAADLPATPDVVIGTAP